MSELGIIIGGKSTLSEVIMWLGEFLKITIFTCKNGPLAAQSLDDPDP